MSDEQSPESWTKPETFFPGEEPEIYPGVAGYVLDRPEGLYIPLIIANNPGEGKVSEFLDTLPRDRRVVFPTVINPQLELMLYRRGFHAAVEEMEVGGVHIMERLPAKEPTMTSEINAVCLLIRHDDLVLGVTRRNDHNDWGLPGGKCEPDENPHDAAVRELKEETGLLTRPEYLTEVFRRPSSRDPQKWVVTYEVRIYVGLLKPLPGEGAAAWVTWEELSKGSFGVYNAMLRKALDTCTFQMSHQRALELGLLICETCGHPPNNHFESGQCAHCLDCHTYKEVGIRGVRLLPGGVLLIEQEHLKRLAEEQASKVMISP